MNVMHMHHSRRDWFLEPCSTPQRMMWAEWLLEHGDGFVSPRRDARAAGINHKAADAANEELEQAGRLLRQKRRKERGAGYWYTLLTPNLAGGNLMNTSPGARGQSDEQALPAEGGNLMVEPSDRRGQTQRTLPAFTSLFEDYSTDEWQANIYDWNVYEELCLVMDDDEALQYAFASNQDDDQDDDEYTLSDDEHAYDREQIERRLGPISQHSVELIDQALDRNREAVVATVARIYRRKRQGLVRNAMATFISSINSGEYLTQELEQRICQSRFPHTDPTVSRRPNGHDLCDACWQRDYAIFYGGTQHDHDHELTATGGAR